MSRKKNATPASRRNRTPAGRLLRDLDGQALTEYVILSATMIAVGAWLYHPNNTVFQGLRLTWERTQVVVTHPTP